MTVWVLTLKNPKKSPIPQIPFDFIGFRFRVTILRIPSIFRDRGNQMALLLMLLFFDDYGLNIDA